MWLTQHSYLNGEWVWILRPAEPVKVGTLMRTMPPLNHDPTTPFCPEFGKIYSLERHVAEIEFENSRRRFDLTTQSVSTLPSMILCKITGVRRSSLHGQVVADVTGGTATSKKIVPTHEMKISAILTARPTITGRSWSFLGFQKPEGGQEIFDPQLGQLVTLMLSLTLDECSRHSSLTPAHNSWIRHTAQYYRPVADTVLQPSLLSGSSPPSPPKNWNGEIMPGLASQQLNRPLEQS